MEICDGLTIGNIREQSIESIFNSKIVDDLRDIIKKDRLIPYCFTMSFFENSETVAIREALRANFGKK